MTEHPVIVVYCEGPPGDRHDRYIIAAYQRRVLNPDVRSQWFPLEQWQGIRLRRVEQMTSTASRAWLRYRIRCGECGYDEQRNEDQREAGGQMFAVFDRLWRHGIPAIPVRELASLIGRYP